MSRRLFLGYAAALAATPMLADVARAQAVTSRPTFSSNPFTLGVASGDPSSDGFVLWTKLAPKPLDPDGGMEPSPVEVAWEVADDEAMTKIVQRGTAVATPKLSHSVHVEVAGLAPDRWYWYRFRAGDAETKPARTRTMPAADATPAKLAFAFASCQHWEGGLWTAYQRMAKDELDLVIHLGDYIYEGGGKDGGVRKHAGPTTITLEHYRQRHAQYKTDPLIQAVHAQAPWLVTWDDHEITNDYANDYNGKPEGGDPAKFMKRRAGAYRAYYEYMPLRASAMPKGPDMLLYRQINFGRLASFNVLDTRQYRTRQVGTSRWQNPMQPGMLDPNATIMGHAQRDWLKGKLADSNATWNVLAQQVMMMMLTTRGPANAEGQHETLYNTEKWSGYMAERIDLMQHIVDRKVSNPVILTGDIHANYICDVRVDDRKPESKVVASEFVGTSISSGGDGTDDQSGLPALKSDNVGLHDHSRRRGYVRCEITPKQWRSDYITFDQIQTLDGKETLKSWVVENGDPTIKSA